MKILVDKLPQKPSECIFADYAANYMICKFSNTKCRLECNERCDELISFEKITIKQ